MELHDSDRLDSWREIAAFIERDERTAMRWAKLYGMPVHHSPGGSHARVYAYRSEVRAWVQLQDHPERPPARGAPATSGHSGLLPARPAAVKSIPNPKKAEQSSATATAPATPELFAFWGRQKWMIILGLGLFASLLLLGELFAVR